MEKQYACIDLKSYYASVECVDRGLDPMTTNLVVADIRRTEKTICLAVTPSLKAHGISGRARLFEVIQQLKIVNAKRQQYAPGRQFRGSSWDDTELRRNPSLSIDYIVAPPRMAHYMECSTKIYQVYLKYVAPEDIHAYSIDEVFIDLTSYLKPKTEAVFTYFQKDRKKSGGAYVNALGFVKDLDELKHELLLTDGTRIPVENVYAVESAAFGRLEMD